MELDGFEISVTHHRWFASIDRIVDGSVHGLGGQGNDQLSINRCRPDIDLEIAFSVSKSALIIRLEMGLQPLIEACPIPRGGRTPEHFSQGRHTGKDHVLEVFRRSDELRPYIRLRTEDVFRKVAAQCFRDRFIFIHLAQGVHPSDGPGLTFRTGLIMVEIARRTRRHHHIMAHLRRFNATGLSAPAHDGGSGCQSALKDLIPSDHLTLPCHDERLYAPDEPALQGLLIPKVLLQHARLTFGT